MNDVFEGRKSDSPYIEMIWRGRTGSNYTAVCPADVRWNLLFRRQNGRVTVSAEGATTQYVAKSQADSSDFLVIKFRLGVFMPYLPAAKLLNGDATLPEAAFQAFWLNGAAWEFPDYDNAETFVDRMVREGALAADPVVKAALKAPALDVSERTVRRRFLQSTGLTHGAIQQIERAQQAAALLEQGEAILDAVHLAGYADQPHMTRSLKRFIGQTPAQIARANQGDS